MYIYKYIYISISRLFEGYILAQAHRLNCLHPRNQSTGKAWPVEAMICDTDPV